jgi:purine-binding chemotaxis protein CheW
MEKGQKKASTSGELMQLVSFHLGSEEYAMEILGVQEIIRMVQPTRIPNAPEFVEGVINLRGQVVPVIGLRKRFGLEQRPFDRQTRIVVLETPGATVGFVVDSVSEVLRIPSDTVEPPPRMTRQGREFVSGIGKLEGRLLLLLDTQKLLDEQQLLACQQVAAEA